MNKENNKSAAGLRRSAVAERKRIQEEWSALKGPQLQQANVKQKTNILTKKQTNVKATSYAAKTAVNANKYLKESTRNLRLTNDTLRGVVALVEVGSECRALPLRAALSALGASVLAAWSPLVTHLVWSQGGCRSTRAKARALASRLVSPLWVEACAASSKRLPEQAFPAAARPSDLPSPRTLRRLLIKADIENLPITSLLSESNEEEQKLPRLRISSETERDTSTDTSKDTTIDTSKDTSRDTTNDTSADIESRVNTAPRRALPKTSSMSSVRPAKSRRKLFTHKEAEITKGSDESDESTKMNPKPRKPSLTKKTTKALIKEQPKVTQRDRRELARAERMARKLVATYTPAITQRNTQRDFRPTIVLTGMCRTERRAVTAAVRSLRGRVRAAVDRRTTHVLLGDCTTHDDYNKTGFTVSGGPPTPRARTVSALAGAARGCRVVRGEWALLSAESGRWLNHSGYEVSHLRKISQKARLERVALGKLHSEYAYDVFNGMRVRISETATQRDAAIQLLNLCGAVVQDDHNRKEQQGENLGHLVCLIAEKLGISCDERDIVSVERTGVRRAPSGGEPATVPRPRPLAVRLARRQLRDTFIQAARVRRGVTTEGLGLAATPARFYVNERLSKHNKMIFFKAREEARSHGWKYVWTKGGRIFVRRESGKASFRVRSEVDLVKIFGGEVAK